MGVDFDAFADNEEKTLAVVHALQIVGEAAQKLPEELTRLYPEIPWADVVGMRNFIVHGYYMVDVEDGQRGPASAGGCAGADRRPSAGLSLT